MYVKEQLLFISKPVYTGIYIYMYLLNVESLLKSSKYALEWVQVGCTTNKYGRLSSVNLS